MPTVKIEPINPWNETFNALVDTIGSENNILLRGPVGCELLGCLNQIKQETGNSMRVVDCSSNTRKFVERMSERANPAAVYSDDYEEERSDVVELSGIVVFRDIHLCNEESLKFFSSLIMNKEIRVGSTKIQLNTNAVIIGTFIDFGNVLNSSIIQLFSSCFVIPELSINPDSIIQKLVWFMREQDPLIQSVEFEEKAVEILKDYQWPGDRQELRSVASIISSDYLPKTSISFEECNRLLSSNTRRSFLDRYRQSQIKKLISGKHIVFRGKEYSAQDAYTWILQLLNFEAPDENHVWEIGYSTVSEIARNYYFSDESVSSYLSVACDKCVAETDAASDVVLLIPETGIKSNQSISRKVYLYIDERLFVRQERLTHVTRTLPGTSLTLICADDFAGTGSQIIQTIVDPVRRATINDYNTKIALKFIFAVAYQDAIDAILRLATPLMQISVYCGHVLTQKDQAFSPESVMYSTLKMKENAKHVLINIVGTELNHATPEGFGDLQSLIVFSDNVPDNTLPAISMYGMVRGFFWKPLFSRVET